MLPLLVARRGITWACNAQVGSITARHESKQDLESFYLWWGPPVIYYLGREEMDLYVRVGHLVWKEIRSLYSW